MNLFDQLKQTTNFIAKTGSAMVEAENLIKYYSQDQAKANRLIGGAVNKLAECRDVDGTPLLLDRIMEKEAADYMGTHAGAISIISQLADKIASLNDQLDNLGPESMEKYSLGSGVDNSLSKTSSVKESLDQINAEFERVYSGSSNFF